MKNVTITITVSRVVRFLAWNYTKSETATIFEGIVDEGNDEFALKLFEQRWSYADRFIRDLYGVSGDTCEENHTFGSAKTSRIDEIHRHTIYPIYKGNIKCVSLTASYE